MSFAVDMIKTRRAEIAKALETLGASPLLEEDAALQKDLKAIEKKNKPPRAEKDTSELDEKILGIIRAYPSPVTASQIAEELDVTEKRTISGPLRRLANSGVLVGTAADGYTLNPHAEL